MKETLKKISNVCRLIFGYGMMVTLFVGGFTFFGYIIALIVGGDAGASICDVIYNTIIPIMIYATTILILFGLVTMYMAGEVALTAGKKKKAPKKAEDEKTN